VIFEVGDENKGFSSKVYDQTWDDLKLIKLKNKYQVKLTKGSHVEKYIVYPRLTGKDYAQALTKFEGKFKVYSEKKSSKEKELKNYEKEYQRNLKKWEKAVNYSKKQEFKHNTKNHPAITYKEISKNQEKLNRIFETKKMGVFNCDRATKYPSASKVTALFIREDGSKMKNLHNVNLVSSNRNSVYRYFKHDLATFGFNPRHSNSIWMIDELGELYACGNSEFKSIQRKDELHVFKMKKIGNFDTVEEFNKLITNIES